MGYYVSQIDKLNKDDSVYKIKVYDDSGNFTHVLDITPETLNGIKYLLGGQDDNEN